MTQKNAVLATGILQDLSLEEEFNRYKGFVCMQRKTGYIDKIPVIIPERFIDDPNDWAGKMVHITGEYQSRNKRNNDKRTLQLYIYADSIEKSELAPFYNRVKLTGRLCNDISVRQIGNGTMIADVILKIEMDYATYYIPCIIWESDLKSILQCKKYDLLALEGKIQSRPYLKHTDDGNIPMVAYEVCTCKVQYIEEELMSKA